MGFLAFCILFGAVGVTIWGAIKSAKERAKLVAEFNEAPLKAIFVMLWVSTALMFFLGVFIPGFGETYFFPLIHEKKQPIAQDPDLACPFCHLAIFCAILQVYSSPNNRWANIGRLAERAESRDDHRVEVDP